MGRIAATAQIPVQSGAARRTRPLRDCIALFEEYGWDWTYHAFRERNGWSVEHEGPDARHMVPSADNPRRRALLDGLRGIVPPSP